MPEKNDLINGLVDWLKKTIAPEEEEVEAGHTTLSWAIHNDTHRSRRKHSLVTVTTTLFSRIFVFDARVRLGGAASHQHFCICTLWH